MSPGPRFLYLHGFASGPGSFKGQALAAHHADRGLRLELLDLRRPSLELLRLSAMMRAVRDALGGERDRAVLLGSSLGGLTACRVAEVDPRVCALVLLAPAFRMFERWRARLGDLGWKRWKDSGWLDIEDHAEKRQTRIDFGFIQEAAGIDKAGGGWPDVRVPTLIIHGRGDDVVPIEVSRTWAAERPHVRLVEVDDGHELTASIERIKAETDQFLAPFSGR
jgi:uncharacterized protein